MTSRLALGCLAIVLGLARPAAGHPLDIGYLRIDADTDAISVTLDLHVTAAARLAGAEPDTLDAAALHRLAGELADATYRRAPLVVPAGPCGWTTAAATLVDRTARLTGHAACPAPGRALRWALPFVRDPRISPTFQILVKARLAGTDHVAIVDPERPALELAGASAPGFGAFVWTGVEHIGAAPGEWRDGERWKLPDGIDHILFLLALMLAGGTVLQIVGIVSGFTLGHSITLALSALDVARPPPALIEPLIALSIALVAGRALLGSPERHRWTIAACFGLIHGFGFATALHGLGLSTGDTIAALLGYNLGVELGQLAIVLVTAPLLLYVQRRAQLRPIVRGVAAVILVAGVTWFLQRL
jgi:hypothetical protein